MYYILLAGLLRRATARNTSLENPEPRAKAGIIGGATSGRKACTHSVRSTSFSFSFTSLTSLSRVPDGFVILMLRYKYCRPAVSTCSSAASLAANLSRRPRPAQVEAQCLVFLSMDGRMYDVLLVHFPGRCPQPLLGLHLYDSKRRVVTHKAVYSVVSSVSKLRNAPMI